MTRNKTSPRGGPSEPASSFPLYLLVLGNRLRVVFPEGKEDVGHCDFWERTVVHLVADFYRVPARLLLNLPYCQRRARVCGRHVYYGGRPAPALLRAVRRALGNDDLVFVHDDHERRLGSDVRAFRRLVGHDRSEHRAAEAAQSAALSGGELAMPRREQKEQRSDPEDRIRAILGVADDEPMPRVGLHSLRKYHAHLAARLIFPFAGKLNSPVGPHRDTRSPLSVVRLMDPVQEYAPEESGGLICMAVQDGERIELPLARIDVAEDSPNRRLLDDYQYWFSVFA